MSEKDKQCRDCQSENIRYDPNHGFYECLECEAVWGYDGDDPDYVESLETVDYGSCCACGVTGPTVRNFLCLERKAPSPGKGWGCVVCHVPADGALAILCDSCISTNRHPTQAIDGYPSEKKRVQFDSLTEEFKHKDVPHDGNATTLEIEEIFKAVGYIPPLMTPLHWSGEPAGKLPAAVMTYLAHVGRNGRTPTPNELLLVSQYLKYWIMAPCWKGVDQLRKRSYELNTVTRISDWVNDCFDIGLDPF